MKFSLSQGDLNEILIANGCDLQKVNVVAVRGFDLNAGKPGVNDRRIYDDLVAVVSPHGVQCFPHNTDPNGYRKGHGTGSSKGLAMLAPGIHIYGTGLHKGAQAFTQCEPFTVIRDGTPPYRDLGWHAINWHSGGTQSTSSLGCQTSPPSVWSAVRPLVYNLLETFNNPFRTNARGQKVRSFPYILLNETDRQDGNLVVSTRFLRK